MAAEGPWRQRRKLTPGQVRGPMMVKGDYASDVTMKLAVWQKDMNVISEFAKAARLPDAALRGNRSDLHCCHARWADERDTAAVCAVLERMARGARSKFKVQSLKFKVSGK